MKIYEILQNLNLVEEKGISRERIESEQYRLYAAQRALIPTGYARFLEKSNGIQTDTLSLFGIRDDESGLIRDIYDNNTLNGTQDQSDKIFLGDNFFEYLVYDWQQKCYLVINKKNENEQKFFPLFEHAVLYFLRKYIEKA